MGRLRQHLCDLVGIRSKGYELLWVLDFPMFTFNPEERRLEAVHHPFTAPKEEDKSLLSRDPLRVRSRAYDLVLNGIELGGGSIRNHRYPDQKEIFERLGIPPEVYEDRFGFLLRALKHGAPPHGGIALGLDRLTMLLSGAQSLREVIAFPKTQRGQDLLFEAPSSVDPEQLLELKIRIVDAGEVR
jgi:aspartyl-tRNA synthetase